MTLSNVSFLAFPPKKNSPSGLARQSSSSADLATPSKQTSHIFFASILSYWCLFLVKGLKFSMKDSLRAARSPSTPGSVADSPLSARSANKQKRPLQVEEASNAGAAGASKRTRTTTTATSDDSSVFEDSANSQPSVSSQNQ